MKKILLILFIGLFLTMTVSAAEVKLDSTVVYLTSPEFSIPLRVNSVTDLYGAAFDLIYDTNLLEILDIDNDSTNGVNPDVVEGSILNQTGTDSTILISGLEDKKEGKLVVGIVRDGNTGVDISTEGILLSIGFRAKNIGITNLVFDSTALKDPYNSTIDAAWINGNVIIYSSPAGIEVTPSNYNMVLSQAFDTSRTLLIKNNGGEPLSFTITDSADWLTANITGAIIPKEDSTLINLDFNASVLPFGLHTAQIEISSNDPDNGLVSIPISLLLNNLPEVNYSNIPDPSKTGDGRVVVNAAVSDINGDVNSLKVEYSRDGLNWNKAELEQVSAGYETPVLNNQNEYQISEIRTDSGVNNIAFYWLSANDFPGIEDENVYLRIQSNDGWISSSVLVSSAFEIDNLAPQGLGNLSFVSKNTGSVSLAFGQAVTDVNFKEYYIYYDTAAITNESTIFDKQNDPNLGFQDYNSASGLTISDLNESTQYFFNIQAIDTFGNISAGETIDVTTGQKRLVSGSMENILQAIEIAHDGDEIKVSPGIYYGNILISGKNIDLSGENPLLTFLDGGNNGSVVSLINVSYGSINNFTILNGSGNLTEDSTNYAGGGIYCENSTLNIYQNIITHNNATYGGGIYCGNSKINIYNNTFSGNQAIGGTGIYASGVNLPDITNSIIWENGDNLYGCEASYSDIKDGDAGEGNIFLDPLFANGNTFDFSLNSASPCIDTGEIIGLDYYGSLPDLGAVEMGKNPLKVTALCPVTLEVLDPQNNTISKIVNNIPNAVYNEVDLNSDSTLDDIITIFNPLRGVYQISVQPEYGALPSETYTLKAEFLDTALVLAYNQEIQNIPASPFELSEVTLLPVSNLSVNDSQDDLGGSINLHWTKSLDDGIRSSLVRDYIILRSNDNINYAPIALISNGNEEYIDTTVIDEVNYYYLIRTSDVMVITDSNAVGPVQSKDNIPPGQVNDLVTGIGNSCLTYSWANPIDIDFGGTKVVRKIDVFAQNPNDGVDVYNSNGTGFTDNGLINEQTYYYSFFTYDQSDNYSSALNKMAVPDGIMPQIIIEGLSNGGYYNTTKTPKISITDINLDSSNIKLNNVAYVSEMPVEDENNYELYVWAKDHAENENTKSINFTIDKTAPNIPVLIYPEDSSVVYTQTVTIVGTAELLSLVSLTIDGNTYTANTISTGQYTFADMILSEGENIIQIWSTDLAGNNSPVLQAKITVKLVDLEVEKSVKNNYPKVLVLVNDDYSENLVNDVFAGEDIYYSIVNLSDDFEKNFRSGKYNISLLLDNKEILSPRVEEEIKYHVYSGDGLIISGTKATIFSNLADVLGIKFKGYMPEKDNLIILDSTLSFDSTLQTTGKSQRVELKTGQTLGYIPVDPEPPHNGIITAFKIEAVYEFIMDTTYTVTAKLYEGNTAVEKNLLDEETITFSNLPVKDIDNNTGTNDINLVIKGIDSKIELIVENTLEGDNLSGNTYTIEGKIIKNGIENTIELATIFVDRCVLPEVGGTYGPYTITVVDKEGTCCQGGQEPAIVINSYGEGKAVFYTFDLTASNTTDNFEQIKEMILKSIEYTTPETTSVYSMSTLPIGIYIQNAGKEVDLKIKEMVPLGTEITEICNGGTQNGNEITWNINMTESENKELRYSLLMPDQAVILSMLTEINYLEYDSMQFYNNYTLDVEIGHSMDELIIEIINDLNGMNIFAENRDYANEAIVRLNKIQSRNVNSKKDIEKNIEDTLKAADSVLKITGVDITSIGMKLVELLKINEVKWNKIIQ